MSPPTSYQPTSTHRAPSQLPASASGRRTFKTLAPLVYGKEGSAGRCSCTRPSLLLHCPRARSKLVWAPTLIASNQPQPGSSHKHCFTAAVEPVGRPLLCHARRADRATPIGRANPANTSSVERNLNWKLETIGAARRTEQDPVCVCVCVCCRAGNPNAFATPDNFADCVPYLNQTLAHYGYPAQINLPTTTDQHAVRHRERGRERGSGAGGLTRELETPLPSNQRTMVQRRATRNSTCGPGPTPHQHRECTFTLGPRQTASFC
jgi:hypothetical protein